MRIPALVMMVPFVISTAIAAEDSQDWRDSCKSWSGLAEHIMSARQAGVSMSSQMDILNGAKVDDTVEQMIIEAYDKPRFGTERYQARATRDFADRIYLECAKAHR